MYSNKFLKEINPMNMKRLPKQMSLNKSTEL